MSRTTHSIGIALVLGGILLVSNGIAGQRPQGQKHARIMRSVAGLLENGHLTRRALDDDISHRAFDAFMRMLDPLKLYLRRSDVQEFRRHRDKLDDMLQDGDPRFAQAVFERFQKRMLESRTMVDGFIHAEHDFTATEQFVFDYDTARRACDDNEARERWRKCIKYDLLRLKAAGVTGSKARERLTRRYRSMQRRMSQLDNEDVLSMFVTAITASYDPHTTYLSRRMLEDFEIHMRLSFQGIGAQLQDEDGCAVIKGIMPGGAAARHGGLKVDDRIVSVGQGRDGDLEDVVGMRLSDIVARIRGKEGTIVRLEIERRGDTKARVIELVRRKTELVDSLARGKVFNKKVAGQDLKIGVIELPTFYGDMRSSSDASGRTRSSAADVRALLEDFSRRDVDAVVLDLRRNGGGLLSEAVGVTGLFIDRGPVVQIKGYRGVVRTHNDDERGVSWDRPVIVLTSKFSASASEIVAGAIKDYRRGLIVGDESTHGKGTVQSIVDLGRPRHPFKKPEKLGALKLTFQQFYRPEGLSTQRRGVRSDIQIPSLTNGARGEDGLPHAIRFDRVPARPHADCHLVDEQLTGELCTRSRERRKTSEHFARVREDEKLYSARRNDKSVTLKEAEFLALQKKFKRHEPEAPEADEAVANPVAAEHRIKRDAYLEEVLAITSDYTRLLAGRRAQASVEPSQD